MATSHDTMPVKTPNVCCGRIQLDGTRITVHRIATLYKQGLHAEQIAQTYAHLTLGQIYLALSCYHAHRNEIDADLAANDGQYEKLKQESAAKDRGS